MLKQYKSTPKLWKIRDLNVNAIRKEVNHTRISKNMAKECKIIRKP